MDGWFPISQQSFFHFTFFPPISTDFEFEFRFDSRRGGLPRSRRNPATPSASIHPSPRALEPPSPPPAQQGLRHLTRDFIPGTQRPEALPLHARDVEAVVQVFRLGEGGVAVFLREEAGVVVGDFDGLVFEEGIAQGEEVLDL